MLAWMFPFFKRKTAWSLYHRESLLLAILWTDQSQAVCLQQGVACWLRHRRVTAGLVQNIQHGGRCYREAVYFGSLLGFG